MFCEKCGKMLEGPEKFCPNCGAPVPPGEETETTGETSVLPAEETAAAETTGETSVPPISVGPQVPADRPPAKNKKAIALIAGGAAVLAVVILCILNVTRLGNFFRRSFSSPEEYYRHVEEATVSELTGAWSRYYELLVKDAKALEDRSTGVEFTVELGDGGRELLGLLGTAGAGVDFTWLNQLSVGMGYSLKDSVMGYALSLGLNQDDLLSANMVLDMGEGGLYLQIPELTPDYIGFDMAELIGTDWLESLKLYREMEEGRRQMLDALPDAGEVEKLQRKYLRLMLNSISEVEKSRQTLKAGGVSQKCTELEVTIDGRTLAGMLEAILEEMQDDKDLKKLIVNTMDSLTAMNGISYLDEYAEYRWSGEDYYDDFLEELGEAQDSLDEIKDLGDLLVMKVYVDGKGRIAGRVLELLEDGEVFGEVSILSPQKGSRTGYEFSAEWGHGEEISLTGSGKTSGNELNGDFGLVYCGITVLDVKVTGLDLKQWERGYLNGSFTVTPSKAISSLLSTSQSYYDTIYMSMLTDLQLTLDSRMSRNGGKITIGLSRDKEDLIHLMVSSKDGGGPEAKVPAGDNTVFLREEEDLVTWWSGIDWDGFIGNLEESDLPEEAVDALQEGIDLFSGDGIGMLLNPYYPFDYYDLYDDDPYDYSDPDWWYDDDDSHGGPEETPDGSSDPDDDPWGEEESLENVLQSEDWRSEVSDWNEQVRELGIILDTVADGNTLVFEWHLPDDDTFNEAVCSVMADSFLEVLESIDFLTAFRVGYGVPLDGVRCTFYKADGSEIYRDEMN